MADHCSGLFNFFAGQPDRDADFQRWDELLLWFEVVVEALESGDEDAVGKTLRLVRSSTTTASILLKNIPRQRYPAAGTAGPRTKASSTQPAQASAAE